MNHETFDDAMEEMTVIVAVFTVHAEILDCTRAPVKSNTTSILLTTSVSLLNWFATKMLKTVVLERKQTIAD